LNNLLLGVLIKIFIERNSVLWLQQNPDQIPSRSCFIIRNSKDMKLHPERIDDFIVHKQDIPKDSTLFSGKYYE